jgi:hypothetical protein
MTFPEWTKPGIFGALIGAVVATILGFSWGGWMTGRGAEELAKNHAASEVTQAMVPICLARSADDPEVVAKLALIKGATSFNQSKAVMEAGWATLPGSEEPNRDLAKACVAELEFDAS